MFGSLLIANRGEIACRVIRTARRMGLRTIAVYSDADAGAQHVAMADEAHRIGPPSARESYLRGDTILDVARRAGAEALHPGYGFLSENAEFAEACAAAGIVFVGPPSAAIRAMGGKSESKALMERAGVPLVPGYHGTAQDAATLAAEAARIGYPVLIKASAGGGGKGMRVVAAAEEFAEALAGAQREAVSSFGDPRVLVEKYLQRPRHIEIQVFGDTHGACISLFERDCSIQRRHQKVIEEAPAPGMREDMRRAMGEAAVAAARAVGYVGAGTVEFIVEDGAFHFMEMNTRLQVEHPVTEMITGLDLVEWQLRVAAGEPLPEIVPRIAGHAFEARVYAEDPARDFLPSVGRLLHLRAPTPGDGVRIDGGVRQGDRIGPDYDPMIAKLVVHAADRDAALRRLRAALGQYEVVGVQTNLALLRGIAADAEFASGGVDTGFIGRHPELLGPADADAPATAIAAAAMALLDGAVGVGRAVGGDADPWSQRDGWRLNLPAERRVTLRNGERVIEVVAADGALRWDGAAHRVERGADGSISVDGLGRPMTLLHDGERVVVVLDGANHVFETVDPLAPPRAAAAAGGRILAPIPGRVASVAVAVGDRVARGQVLVVLEAMKMELRLTAPADATVETVMCAAGEMVEDGRELVVLGG